MVRFGDLKSKVEFEGVILVEKGNEELGRFVGHFQYDG